METYKELIKELCFEWFKIGFKVGIQNPAGTDLETEFKELWKKEGID